MIRSGVIFNDRYEIMNRIGTGGMAEVYKGMDHKLNRLVAVKVLKKEFREDAGFVQKFEKEAQSAAGLMHPNVVNVYDVGEYRGLYYMVMELVEGITLKDYIVKKGRLSWKEVVSVSIQVCAGIDAAHQQGLIHRDIKPQNIIISREGKVKVTDFGIARAASSNTISTNMMGSVHYTSPEQARGGFSDIRSDVYSLGITMYEMITGRVPFDGDSTVSIAMKHLQEDIVPPSEYEDLPYSLERIILKCTQKSADRRYQNMNALTLDLKRSLVDPDGDFVVIAPLVNHSDTVMVTSEELSRIQSQTQDQDDEEDGFVDDEEDDEEDTAAIRGKSRKDDELDEHTKKANKVMKIVAIVIIALVALLAIAGAAGILKVPSSGTKTTQSDTVKVPDVVGKSQEEAEKIITDKGLKFKVVSTQESDKYDNGLVAEQKTQAGTKVPKNTTINVVVSSGLKGKEIAIPDVTGMAEDDAKQALKDAGFKSTEVAYEYNDSVEEGYVIGTTPAAGSAATEDTKITVTVSKGAQKVSVPNLTGKDADTAASSLSNAGLNGEPSYDYSDKVAAGTVISQDPKSGSKVTAGSTVSYVISQGPEAKSMAVPNLSGKTESQARQAIKDAGLTVGKVTYENSSVTAGYVVSQSIGSGQQVDEGTAVDLVISQGMPENTEDTGNTTDETDDVNGN